MVDLKRSQIRAIKKAMGVGDTHAFSVMYNLA